MRPELYGLGFETLCDMCFEHRERIYSEDELIHKFALKALRGDLGRTVEKLGLAYYSLVEEVGEEAAERYVQTWGRWYLRQGAAF